MSIYNNIICFLCVHLFQCTINVLKTFGKTYKQKSHEHYLVLNSNFSTFFILPFPTSKIR